VFQQSISKCAWNTWERWVFSLKNLSLYQICVVPVKLTRSAIQPREATPHHLIFIADPQLVDPHTYPGRPWPLSTLTTRHTDLYLRRSFSLLQRQLHPDTVFFLGDLFDGGREWATDRSRSPEKRYRKYGETYWLKEYNRFGRIFFDHWVDGSIEPGAGQQGRKIIASLPGNHDLGIGSGIQLPVRDRFKAYFGDGSRIDIIANHTFVSVDTVSLSAMDQPDPPAGSEGSRLGDGEGVKSAIWKPVQDFLEQAKLEKSRAVERHLTSLGNQTWTRRLEHTVTDLNDSVFKAPENREVSVPDLPTILLTHVPLYRAPGTPCGPNREHWPPSKPTGQDGEQLLEDERNAIAVRAGYQYQNVLTPAVSRDLIEKVGNVGNVFSGDDHDYCEIVHREFTASSMGGRIREITVKSMSWAMGVRKPGFLMVTLWNPIDAAGKPTGKLHAKHGGVDNGGGSASLQSHLCLLPDQLGIFTRYALLFGLTLITLTIRSVIKGMNGTLSSDSHVLYSNEPILPISLSSKHPTSSAESEKAEARFQYQRQRANSQKASEESHSSNSSTSSKGGGLAARSSAARTRSLSPALGYGIPTPQVGGLPQADYNSPISSGNGVVTGFHAEQQPRINIGGTFSDHGSPRRGVPAMIDEALRSMWRVGWVASLWYVWLVWHG